MLFDAGDVIFFSIQFEIELLPIQVANFGRSIFSVNLANAGSCRLFKNLSETNHEFCTIGVHFIFKIESGRTRQP